MECCLTVEDFTIRVPFNRATEWNRLQVSIDWVLENQIKPVMCGVDVCEYPDQKTLKDAWVYYAFAQHAKANYMTVGSMNVSVKTSTESLVPTYSEVAYWAKSFEQMGLTALNRIEADCKPCAPVNQNIRNLNPFA